MKKPIITTTILTLLLFFIGYNNFKKKQEIEQYYFLSNKMSDLKTLNYEIDFFNANMIQANNYDIIEEKLTKMMKIQNEIAQTIENLYLPQSDLVKIFTNISQSLIEKEKNTQLTKSYNSVINNSYSYIKKIKPSIRNQTFDILFIEMSDIDKISKEQLAFYQEKIKAITPQNTAEKQFLLHAKVILEYFNQYQSLQLIQKQNNLLLELEKFNKTYTAVSQESITKVSYLIIGLFCVVLLFIFLFLYDAYRLYKNNISVTRFKKAVENSDNIVMITDTNQKITYVNQSFTNYTGYTANEAIGKSPKDFQSGLNAKNFYKKLNQTIYNGDTWSGTFINKSKDGSKQYEKSTISPIKDDNGNILEFVCLKLNITKELEAANLMRENEKKLFQQAKMQSLGEMLHNIAHHWRQPLSLISTVATSIDLQKEMGMLNDEQLTKGMSDINKTAQQLSATIEDFSNFFDDDKVKEYFSLKDIIKRTLNLLMPDIQNNNIKLDIKEFDDIKLYGLDNELIQTIINIFNNAIDILANQTDRYIQLETTQIDQFVEITIHDSGGGIPEKNLKKIFEPYFTTKHKSQGKGLGLYGSYMIVTNHMNGELFASNGSFRVDGNEYFGAKFTIRIGKNS